MRGWFVALLKSKILPVMLSSGSFAPAEAADACKDRNKNDDSSNRSINGDVTLTWGDSCKQGKSRIQVVGVFLYFTHLPTPMFFMPTFCCLFWVFFRFPYSDWLILNTYASRLPSFLKCYFAGGHPSWCWCMAPVFYDASLPANK